MLQLVHWTPLFLDEILSNTNNLLTDLEDVKDKRKDFWSDQITCQYSSIVNTEKIKFHNYTGSERERAVCLF